MKRQVLSLIVMVVVVACCGCNTETGDATSSSHENEHTRKMPDVGGSETNASRTIDHSQSRTDTATDPIEDQRRYVSFPAVGVKLVRPDGFDDAENFHGFQQPSTQSSVMLMKIPGPFSEITRGLTAEQLKKRGITLGSKEDVEIDGHTGIILGVTQNAFGTEFAKWIVTFGDEEETRMVTATFPKSDETKLSDHLRAVVLSTKEDDTPAPAPGADAPFTIAASKKMKPTAGVGKALLYTKDGTIPAKSPEDPLYIAAPSLSKVPIENKRQFAVQRLFQTAHTKITAVTSNNEITIDGMDGYEIVADAEDTDSGTPLIVYQVVLYDDGSYILIQGLVGAKIAGEYLPEFKSMARSLTRKAK